MDWYTIEDASCRIGPDALICDANFLIALHSPHGDKLSYEAGFVMDNLSYQMVVPVSAIVEAFHMCKDNARSLLEWVTDYTKVELLPEDTRLLAAARGWHLRIKELDLVDCLLLEYAIQVAKTIGRTRPLPILTADVRMMNMARGVDASLTFLNLNEPLDGIF